MKTSYASFPTPPIRRIAVKSANVKPRGRPDPTATIVAAPEHPPQFA
jgi:hypothetical protein